MMPTKKKTVKETADPKAASKLRWLDITVAVVSVSLVGYGLWQVTGKTQDRPLCAEIGSEHQVALDNDVFTPGSIELSRCDRVIVTNQGNLTYDLALGTHDEHIEYAGFERQMLRPGEYFTFNALQSGSYPLHDHTRDKAKLQLNIN